MAQMFPSSVQWKLGQGGERKFYEACQTQLDSEYVVFYSVQWLALDKNNRPQDSEADFIIAHPDLGVLVLEVKGGPRITFDPASGKWHSYSHAGNVSEIKFPVQQAVAAKHNLERALKPMLDFPTNDITFAHAVVFPDAMSSIDYPTRPDMPRDIVVDNGDLADLPARLRAISYFFRGNSPAPTAKMGKGLLNALRTLLGRAVEFRPALWGEFVDETNEMVRLTQDQFDVLEGLQMHTRALVWGCAGSGKTLIATEKAIRLARQGMRVLLTCFNKGLASFMKERLAAQPDFEHLQLSIVNFHDLCEQLAEEAGLHVDKPKDQTLYYNEVLSMALLEAAAKLNVQYDALIVDEGQDFKDDWWATLQSLLVDPDNSILYIFYDEQQRIYPDTGKFPIQGPPYLLTKNCRNTRKIHRQMLKFYTGTQSLTAQGPQGRHVQVATFDPVAGIHSTLAAVLEEITAKGKVPYDQIVVLTPSRQHTQLWSKPLPGRVGLCTTWPPPANQVYSTTVHAYKGLEASVVVLVDLERWQTGVGRVPIDSVLYVACSRARNHLAVLLPTNAPAEIAKHFR